MNKLRFTHDQGSVFYKDLVAAIDHYFESNKLQKSGNYIMYLKIGIYFILDILLYVFMVTSDTVQHFYIFYLLLGISVLLTAFNISHDAAHGVAVKSKFWNKLLFQLSFQLQGNNAYVWGKNHTESHHLYTNVEGSDIDVLNNPAVRMTEQQPLKWFHRFQYLYVPILYLLYSLNWLLFRETLMIFNYSSRTIKIMIPRLEIVKLVFFKLVYLLCMIMLPAFLLPLDPKHILFAFLLNHFIISWIFTGVLAVSHLSDFVQHPKPDQTGNLPISWPSLQMQTSVDYNPGSVILNWTLGGFNAHALHHLLPNISHVHYLRILPLFREICRKHNITYMEMSYREALASHFRFLKNMGKTIHPKTRVYERQAY